MCKCCFGSIEGESCGWPKGTVRASIAMITIPLGFLSTTAVIIILIVKEQYTIALGVNSVIWGVVGTIVGHYFGTKQAEGAAKMISQNDQELIRSQNMMPRYISMLPSAHHGGGDLGMSGHGSSRDVAVNIPRDINNGGNDSNDSDIVLGQ